ncbi:MAG: cytochrome c biogenesis CcdA family protein [Actinomycetes bacterium]
MVTSSSLLIAVPVAALAGLVSFLSPCVVPLVPGYLSYVTGLAGSDLAQARRGRMLAGSVLFVAGFTVVFVAAGVFVGGLGVVLLRYQRLLQVVLGAATIVFGLSFIGLLPGMSRELRVHRRPVVGLAGAPLLGVLFGLGWTPCIGPTLGAVLTLAANEASMGRGAVLAVAYCLGLGVPFVLVAVAFRSGMGALAVVKRHYAWVMRAGGGLLVVLGVLLVSGAWSTLMDVARGWASRYGTVL